jgi:NAD(P)-dependent dehydrogenase (short-subunit alcohol dehydrogenase family)
MSRSLQDRVVVITGAGSGLGRELARQFAEAGAKLVLADINETALPETVQLAKRNGTDVEARVLDMADPAAVLELAAHAVQVFGSLDVWVNNAAVSVYGDFTALPPAEFRRVIEVNLLGYANGIRAALSQMEQGTIICVTSNVALRGIPLQSAYSASKHGIHGLIQAVRTELLHHHSRVALCEVQPVGIDTTMFEFSKTRLGVAPQVTGQTFDPTPVAAAVVRCARQPQREVPVGFQATFVRWADLLMPRVLDWYLARETYEDQQTKEPRSPDAPNDLFGSPHLPGAIRGHHPGRRHSPYTWAVQHPKTVAGTVAIAALAVMGWRRSA